MSKVIGPSWVRAEVVGRGEAAEKVTQRFVPNEDPSGGVTHHESNYEKISLESTHTHVIAAAAQVFDWQADINRLTVKPKKPEGQ